MTKHRPMTLCQCVLKSRSLTGTNCDTRLNPTWLSLFLCCPTLGTRGCSSLRSLEQGLLFVSFARTPQARPVHSRWLAPLYGMGFHYHSDCSLRFIGTSIAPQGSFQHILL